MDDPCCLVQSVLSVASVYNYYYDIMGYILHVRTSWQYIHVGCSLK